MARTTNTTCCRGSGVASVLVQIAALVGVGTLVGMAHSSRVRLVAPAPKESPAPVEIADGSQTPALHNTLGPRLTLAQTKSLFEDGVPFIDARPDHERNLGTIPGSFHITPGSFSTIETGNVLVLIDPDKPVVVFCGGGDCQDSENLAALMKDAGYKSLHIFTDGFPAWEKAGYEVGIPEPSTPTGVPKPAGGG